MALELHLRVVEKEVDSDRKQAVRYLLQVLLPSGMLITAETGVCVDPNRNIWSGFRVEQYVMVCFDARK